MPDSLVARLEQKIKTILWSKFVEIGGGKCYIKSNLDDLAGELARELSALCRAWQEEQGKERDEALRRDNIEIELQQTLQRMTRAGEMLEDLKFWPVPDADKNLTRDIGRVLQGKKPTRSQGVEEVLSAAGAFSRSWKQRAESAEARLEEQGWQPIGSYDKATCPFYVLVATEHGVGEARQHDNGAYGGAWFWANMSDDGAPGPGQIFPTHWMPLPAAPTPTEE